MSVTAPGAPSCGKPTATTGAPCRQPAGQGTNHVGRGACRRHDGSPDADLQGARMNAGRMLARWGVPRQEGQSVLELLEETSVDYGILAAQYYADVERDGYEAPGGRLSPAFLAVDKWVGRRHAALTVLARAEIATTAQTAEEDTGPVYDWDAIRRSAGVPIPGEGKPPQDKPPL